MITMRKKVDGSSQLFGLVHTPEADGWGTGGMLKPGWYFSNEVENWEGPYPTLAQAEGAASAYLEWVEVQYEMLGG